MAYFSETNYNPTPADSFPVPVIILLLGYALFMSFIVGVAW